MCPTPGGMSVGQISRSCSLGELHFNIRKAELVSFLNEQFHVVGQLNPFSSRQSERGIGAHGRHPCIRTDLVEDCVPGAHLMSAAEVGPAYSNGSRVQRDFPALEHKAQVRESLSTS